MDYKEIIDINIDHVDIDEFKQRVRVHPKTNNARLVWSSGIAKVAGFPSSLVAPELVMDF